MVGPTGGRAPLGRHNGTLARQGAMRRRETNASAPNPPLSRLNSGLSHSLDDLSQGTHPQSPLSFRRHSLTSLSASVERLNIAADIQNLSLLAKRGAPDLPLLQSMQPYAVLANFLYQQDQAALPANWTVMGNGAIVSLLTQAGITDFMVGKDGIITTNQGLVAYVFENKAENKVCIGFGGTTSGDNAGTLTERMRKNVSQTMKQWLANAKNAIEGKVPDCYQQAVMLTQAINAHSSAMVEVTGHSLGGGMASYAAAMEGNEDMPMAAHGFCSAELGKQMLNNIKARVGGIAEKVSKLTSGITHLKIKGDIVPNMHRLFSVSNVGASYTIAPDENGGTSALDYHVNFLAHINSEIARQSS